MSGDFDREVELAQYFGQDPQERIADLTTKREIDPTYPQPYVQTVGASENENVAELSRLQPVREGSKLTNDPLQIALARHFRQSKAIELVGAVAQERKAYSLAQQAEKHLEECNDHWNACQTRMFALKEQVSEEVWESIYYGKDKPKA